MDKSICFLTVGDITWASSRLRSYWPVRYIPGAVTVQWGQPGQTIPEGYALYVWMKTGHVETMEQIHCDGGINIIEVCDPAWWWMPEQSREIDRRADYIVAASDMSLEDYQQWSGRPLDTMRVIPDRLELSAYPIQRQHRRAEPVRLIWFGMAQNRAGLFAALANLERLVANGVAIELTVLDNAPEQPIEITDAFPIYHTRWSLESENAIIAAHDIAVLPPYPGPWGKLKTNNRQLVGWACGLPVTDGQDYASLYDLATLYAERATQAAEGRAILERDYDVRLTAADWLRLLAEVGRE